MRNTGVRSIPVFFVSDRYTIIICGGGPIGNGIPERKIAGEGDICPAAVCIRVLPKKFQKNYEKQRKRS